MPVPVSSTVSLFHHEVLGCPGLKELSSRLYRDAEGPAMVSRTEKSYEFAAVGGHYEVKLRMPLVQKAEIGLFRKNDELVVEVGTLRRHIGPRATPCPGCVCDGKGPMLSQMLEMMMPPAAAGEHFKNARLEFLKGVRELLDQRIQ